MASRRSRRRSETRRDLTIAAAVIAFTIAAAVGGLWVAGKTAAVGPFACAGYQFERSEWHAAGAKERRDEARLMARCGHLEGKSRRQVRRELGAPDGGPAGREWRFFIGQANDYLRLGDSSHLIVRFNRSGRVSRTLFPERSD